MSFCNYSKEYSVQGFTDIENTFIFEYMPEASGNAVKVYLFGLFLCKNSKFDFDIETFAKSLHLTVSEVKDAFLYWEEFGLVLINEEPFSVLYLPYDYNTKHKKIKPEKYAGFSSGLQALIPNRMISTSEFMEYYEIMETYGIKEDAMLMIVKYCIDLKGENVGYKYISTVARDFGARGILNYEQTEKAIGHYILRSVEIEKILSALKLKRKPEIEDLEYFNKWTKDLGFETDNIVFAAGKIKKGGIKKLDEFLLKLYSAKKFSKEEIKEYILLSDKIYETAIKICKSLSVYYDVMDTVLENYVIPWINQGFDEESLLLVSKFCFKKGKNTLEYMDGVLSSLSKEGIINYASIAQYFINYNKEDKFISSILSKLYIARKPNSWDRANFSRWRNWNFSDEMIEKACEMAEGKENPIPYMNAILGSWKQQNIYSPSEIKDAPKKGGESKHFEGERLYSEEELDKVFDDVDSIEF